MKTIACYKVVSDEQDVEVKADRTLDESRAEKILGEYDLVAIEEAVQLATESGGTCSLLTVGTKDSAASKVVKAALSRGADELYTVCDDLLTGLSPYQTASILAKAIQKIEGDLVVCGEGSGDMYAQQVGCLMGSILGYPTINAVSKIEICDESHILATRVLEKETEIVKLSLPAVVCVTSDAALPRIPQLKDILAAGKKPVHDLSIDDLGELCSSKVKTISTFAPESVERKGIIYEEVNEENIEKIASEIKLAF